MAVVIRLTRRGRKNRPFYRIGVFDANTRRDGVAVETLGYYNPIATEAETALELDVERARHWISVGARPSDTVASFLRKEKIELKGRGNRSESNRKRTTKRKAARKAKGGSKKTASSTRKPRLTSMQRAKLKADKASASK